MQLTKRILEAAYAGLLQEKAKIEGELSELRAAIEGKDVRPLPVKSHTAAPVLQPKGKRKLNAAARKRIAAAQKKRWAAFHAEKRKKGAAAA